MDWTCLDRVCASEVLKFEETAAAALEQVQLGLPTEGQKPKAAATQGDRSPSPIFSPRGALLMASRFYQDVIAQSSIDILVAAAGGCAVRVSISCGWSLLVVHFESSPAFQSIQTVTIG